METELPLDHVISVLVDKQRRRKRNNVRYATDPQYREQRQASAREWNATHPTRKRVSDKKWSAKNGAAASKRYRQRQAAKSC